MSESDFPGNGPGRRDPGSAAGDGQSMIDLPLRPDQGRQDEPRVDTLPPVQRVPPKRPGRRRGGLFWLVPALIVIVILWWLFWPAPARIVTSETSLVFETTRVGTSGGEREVTVSNAGERSLRLSEVVATGDAAADFVVDGAQCAAALAPGDSCAITVGFQPVAAGERRASVEFRGKAGNAPFQLPLSGSAIAPAVGLAPESVNFGAVQVGQQRARLKLVISNIGSAPLELGRVRFEGPQADEFDRDQRCPRTRLAPGEACSFDIRFSPTAAGQRVAELVIASDDPNQPARLPLRGRGVWEGPPLDADPLQLDLGEQRVGRRSGAGRVRFSNRTAGSVDVASVELSPPPGPFTIINDGCGGRALISGETCDVSVAVEPAAEGSLEASLEVGFTAAGTLRVPLTAVGVAPRLDIERRELAFGELRVGFESGPRSVDLLNTGSATLVIEASTIGGPQGGDFVFKQDCREAELSPGERCSLRLAFRPGAAGSRSATLTISPSDELPSLEVALGGVGTVAGLAVAPGSLAWPSLQVGKADDRTLVMSNTGTARLTVSGLRITGDAEGDFAVRGIGCRLDAGLSPGESCEVTVRFAPSVDGDRQARVEISHNGPESPHSIALSGTGEPPRPLFRASARDFGFGTVALGGRSEIATLTISNPGSEWLSLNGVSLRGEHGADYELVPGTCDGVTALAPGGSCTVGVRFVPLTAGRRRATLEIRHSAGGSPALITLAGIGS